MSSPILSVKNASISFAKKILFEDLNLNLFYGDQICLIGKNGVGKTTLINAIAKKVDLDYGEIWTMPNTKIGYLEQNEQIQENISVFDYISQNLNLSAEKSYLIDIICEKLQISKNDFTHNLSGGQKRRANLAKVLAFEPEILLLDEPTNHLDLEIIQWLEDYLKNYRGAVITISHDRRFLEKISNKVFWLRSNSIKINNQGYKNFEEWSQKIIDHENREMNNLEKKLELESSWLETGVTGRRKRNIGRLHYLEQLRNKIKAQKQIISSNQSKIIIHNQEKFDQDAPQIIANINNISKSYEDKKIIENFSLKILRGEKIGIIGKNGSGKTTFLKLLTKETQSETGTVKLARNLEFSYFDQDRRIITKEKTIKEILCEDGSDFVKLANGKQKHVCGYLSDFLFDPKDINTLACTLSGGQQNRLILAKTLANPKNFLILDEPTNDLDIESLDILQEYLEKYEGTALIVSHDRDFLDNSVSAILSFEQVFDENENIHKNKIIYHFGGYSDYEEYVKKFKQPQKNNKKIINNSQNQFQKNNKKSISKLRNESEKISLKISKIEEKILELNDELLNCEERNPANLAQISIEISNYQKEIENLEEKWLEIEEEILTN